MTKAEAGRIAAAALAAVALTACKHTHPTTGPGQVSQPILTPSGCREQSLTLYFDSGSDALTDAGRQLVADTSKQLKSCTVKELRVINGRTSLTPVNPDYEEPFDPEGWKVRAKLVGVLSSAEGPEETWYSAQGLRADYLVRRRG